MITACAMRRAKRSKAGKVITPKQAARQKRISCSGYEATAQGSVQDFMVLHHCDCLSHRQFRKSTKYLKLAQVQHCFEAQMFISYF
jgi:hypothetical protein